MTAPRIVPNDRIIAAMNPADRKACGLKTREEITAKQDGKAEKKIQAEVEAWLRIHGYWPRTPAFLDGKKPAKGWFIHLFSAQKNPIVLDLLILSHDGRYLELELKTERGPVRPQQAVILQGRAKIARSVLDAIKTIQEWEDEEENRR